MPTAKKKATRPVGEPRGIRAGLPQVPALYGLKPRAKYLPFRHAEDRLARSRNYWICTTRPDGRPIQFRFGDSGLMALSISAPPGLPARRATWPKIRPSLCIWIPATRWSSWKGP